MREFPDHRERWVTVGESSRNVGITQFAVRKAYYGAFDYQAFLSITNFSDERVSFPLALTVDGAPVERGLQQRKSSEIMQVLVDRCGRG